MRLVLAYPFDRASRKGGSFFAQTIAGDNFDTPSYMLSIR